MALNATMFPVLSEDGNESTAPSPDLRVQILGPLRVWRRGVEVEAGPRQQAYLLALLLARQDQPLSKAELIQLIWGERAPDSALNVIHKYVGALRRVLEPDLPAGSTSTLIMRRGSSYVCALGSESLDLADFRALVASAQAQLSRGDERRALDLLVDALSLWRGPSGEGLSHTAAAIPIFAGVDEEFFAACVEAADVAIRLGRPDAVLVAVQLAATIAPLNEPVQAGLISLLGAAGRQAEALSVYAAVRTRLADELGIDPGAAIELAQARVLRQELMPAINDDSRTPSLAAIPVPPQSLAPPRTASGHVTHRSAPERITTAQSDEDVDTDDSPLAPIGRDDELATLHAVLRRTAKGAPGFVVIEGEPGSGKTYLLEHVAAEASHAQFSVAWGRCLDGAGAPPMWPWVEIVRSVVDALPVSQRDEVNGDLLRLIEPAEDPLHEQLRHGASGQFRLFEQVVELLADVARNRPIVLMLDDLQWADVATLHLLGHLATRLPRRVALVAARRDRAPDHGSEHARVLALASRTAGHRRIFLGPLDLNSVAALVHRDVGEAIGKQSAQTIHARTAGNPFFVRELARMLAESQGVRASDTVRPAVPLTVRDVVCDRLVGLDESTRDLLGIASLIGREINFSLLAHVADVDVVTCLAQLEAVQALGLLAPTPGDPRSIRFVHDLVREAVAETVPSTRAAHLHLRVANALELIAPDGEPEMVAHHLWIAGPLADPRRTINAVLRSARRAAERSALEAAEQQLRMAAGVARRSGLAECELLVLAQLTAVIGMRSMYAGAEASLLERAEDLARSLGRELEATGFLYSRWATHAQGIELDRSAPLARRLLQQGEASANPVIQAYGLQAWGIHQWDVGHIGEAFRYLRRSEAALLATATEEDPLRRDLRLLMLGLLAEVSALHGDVPDAMEILAQIEAGGTDAYAVTVWATMCVRVAVITGNVALAISGADRGIAVDPDFSFVFMGTYTRLAQCWAQALTGPDPAAAAEKAERLIAANLLNPVRSCVSTWHGLLAQMWIAAGDLEQAEAALDRADYYLRTYGQRYGESLILLIRAELLKAQRAPRAIIRDAAEAARRTAAEQEAHLLEARAREFFADLNRSK
ncbi:BREX system ATP-binding domain-containing protein [Nocardioides sp. NPDC004968]|uniref:BTAD domain-containing putative transcriptional regulator n=1 Tax=Nocardioides sp. NPDC004968 TaxID=3155894 RepID=UPI0033A9CD11